MQRLAEGHESRLVRDGPARDEGSRRRRPRMVGGVVRDVGAGRDRSARRIGTSSASLPPIDAMVCAAICARDVVQSCLLVKLWCLISNLTCELNVAEAG